MKNSDISAVMRAMQKRSMAAQWAGQTPAQRAAKMSALARARWSKRGPKTVQTPAHPKKP